MSKLLKVFMNNRSQAVRIPKEFQFKTKEVYARQSGNDLILSPVPESMAEYFANQIIASPDFMAGVDDPPPEDKELF